MEIQPLLQELLPPVLALFAALLVDRMSERRGLLPAGFLALPNDSPRQRSLATASRLLALLVLAALFWIGVFGPLGGWGREEIVDFSLVPTWQLFLLHMMLALGLLMWFGLGRRSDVKAREEVDRRPFRLGLSTRNLGREIGLGLAGGVVAWLTVIVAVLGLTGLLWTLGAEGLLPQTPPAIISWVVALPVAVRLAVSLSAGVVEEIFFRGFLQPRIGLALSSLFFVVAHMSYGQPLMLVGVAVLSVFFGLLVVWRRNLWAAVAAHFVFDAIQMVVVIPAALEFMPEDGAAAGVALLVSGLAR